MVGLDAEAVTSGEQGFMDGFASVLQNLSNPDRVGADDAGGAATKSEKQMTADRRAKIRALNEQARPVLTNSSCLLLASPCLVDISVFCASRAMHTSIADFDSLLKDGIEGQERQGGNRRGGGVARCDRLEGTES